MLGFLIAVTALQAALQAEYSRAAWLADFRFWATVLTIASLCVIFAIQHVEHWRSRKPSGVVLFFWLFFIIAYCVKLRSLVARHTYRTHVAYFAVFCIALALGSLEFVLEYFVPKERSDYYAVGDEDECPFEYADIFSVLTFGWMTSLMKKGYKQYLKQEDLWNLRNRDTTKVNAKAFRDAWKHELQKKKPSLWIALFRGYGGPYFKGALIKTISDVTAFIQPQLLRLLITFVGSYQQPNPEPVIHGVAIALAMFSVAILQTVSLHQYFRHSFETGMRIKSGLTAAIYSKALRLSNEGRATKSTGDIVNYMAVDTQRLHDLAQYGQQLWSAPFQIFLCMLSLYQLLGVSMLAGVAAMVSTFSIASQSNRICYFR